MTTRLLLTGHYIASGGAVYFESRRKFTRNEVRALGVDINDIDLVDARHEYQKREDNLSLPKVLKKAKQLRPAKAPHSPLCPFALTLDNVKPGMEFIWYNLGLGLRGEDAFTSAQYNPSGEPWARKARTRNSPRGGIYLADAGITQYKRGGVDAGWSDRNFLVANTTEGRQQFVNWLVKKGDAVALRAAAKLAEKYLSDFMTVKVSPTTGAPGLKFEVTTKL